MIVIERTTDEIRESFQRVYERVQRAQDERAESVEITRQEAFDLYHRQTVYDSKRGVSVTAGVDMGNLTAGLKGAVIGFPCVIVETLTDRSTWGY